MDFRRLRSFIVVARERNFTRAARKLHLSQPPLSRSVSQLESELGVELIRRNAKQFSLTEAGEFLYQESQRILESLDACLERTRLIGKSAKASLRIAAAGSLMHSIVPAVMAIVSGSSGLPRFELLEMSTENQAQALLSGRIDIGFLREWADVRGLAYESLGREGLAVAYPRAWREGGREFAGLGDFSGLPFISGHEAQAPGLAEATRRLCEAAGFSPAPAYECDRLTTMLKLGEAGLGWAIVPSAMAQADERLAVLELGTGLAFGMAYRPGRLPESVEAIASTARTLFGNSVSEYSP